MDIALRPATAQDRLFLTEMLAAAAFWRSDVPAGNVSDVLASPELAHYVAGWPRPGDRGLVAEATGPVGAAWLRVFPRADPGYGFVDATTPELSMGVAPRWRGQGIGTRLLDALLASACEADVAAVSLSVERDNTRARRLYERAGFRVVADVGAALTMVGRL